MRKLIHVLLLFLPWRLRRLALCTLLGYEIDPTCRIGLSLIMPSKLVMKAHARIGHFTLCKGIDLLKMGEHSSLGNGNWITGYPSNGGTHFVHQHGERHPVLEIGRHAAVTNRHLIDCTNAVKIGQFATFAGFQSQILTHSIDLNECRQSSAPVSIGEYCFVGTNVVVLGGSSLPDHSVLGAKSLLNKVWDEPYTLYGGVPAKPLRSLGDTLAYFHRDVGFVS